MKKTTTKKKPYFTLIQVWKVSAHVAKKRLFFFFLKKKRTTDTSAELHSLVILKFPVRPNCRIQRFEHELDVELIK